MTTRAIPPVLALALVTGVVATAGARSPRGPEPRGRATIRRALIVDNSQRIDVNQISMVVTNTGSIAYDKATGSAGLEYPKGSGKTAVFAAGPWLGARRASSRGRRRPPRR